MKEYKIEIMSYGDTELAMWYEATFMRGNEIIACVKGHNSEIETMSNLINIVAARFEREKRR